METQEAHASEIGLRIAALEADFTPLFGDSAGERCVGTQLLPQLQDTQTTAQFMETINIQQLFKKTLHISVYRTYKI